MDDAAFGERVRAYLLAHPEVLQEVSQKLQTQAAAAADAEARRRIAQNRSALIADVRDPVIGRPDAPIAIVEFFDYRCGYCKASAPELLAFVEQHPDVRLVMKEMPILSAESEYAARVALLAADQGKYGAVHRALMTGRAVDRPLADRVARDNGVDISGLNAPSVTQRLDAVHELAGKLGIGGTPAFVVGDRLINGADMAALQRAVAEQRRSVPKAAG